MSTNSSFKEDFFASFVVFLVALPLCMGIALASGVPPILGIVSGAIGGLVVGALSGSPLQVSGPAAGLAVMVFEIVEKQGMAALAVCLVIGGIFQLVCSAFRVGPLFRAISPAVIKGMLAGIGVLIFCSQFHVMVDGLPKSSGVENLVTIPDSFLSVFDTSGGMSHVYAGLVGLLTIAVIIAWNFLREKFNSNIPSPLLAVGLAVAVTSIFKLPIKTVEVPQNLFGSLQNYLIWNQTLTWQWSFLIDGFALGFIAATETLLSVTAVDKMTGGRSKYNQELFAQGVGNTLAGVLGVLPITGVIVRSTANIDAGAKTRTSAILHAIWLTLALTLFPQMLGLIPTSSLAALLVYIGYRLVKFQDMKSFFQFEKTELFIYLATIFGIVTINLLYGVLIGFGLGIAKLLWRLSSLEIEESGEGTTKTFKVTGSASFLAIPRLADRIECVDDSVKHIVLDLTDATYVDHAIQELISDWDNTHNSTIRVKLHQGRRFTTSDKMKELAAG